jgi:hypothetical protein
VTDAVVVVVVRLVVVVLFVVVVPCPVEAVGATGRGVCTAGAGLGAAEGRSADGDRVVTRAAVTGLAGFGDAVAAGSGLAAAAPVVRAA